MIKHRCGVCGAPLYTRIFRKWNRDGTVTGRLSPGVRICHIEADDVNHLISGISERLGHPIDRVVIEGERKAGRSIARDSLGVAGGLPWELSWGRIGVPVALKAMLDVTRSVGFGDARVIDYKKGKRLRLLVLNHFCLPVVVGDLWGGYEAVEDTVAEASWRDSPQSVFIEFHCTGVKLEEMRESDEQARLELKKLATLPGEVEFRRCERCGIPREVTGAIEWDLDRGIVTRRVTGEREVTIMVEAINAVLRELTVELGEEIPRIAVEVEAEYTRDRTSPISGSPETEDYVCLLEDLWVKGMGNLRSVERSGRDLKVRIDNPFCEPLLAGKVAGYYWALEGDKPKVEWTPDEEGFTVIEVSAD